MSATDAAAVFHRHHAALLRYLARYTGDADEAADIAQEAFVKFLRSPPADEIAVPWLYRVATNLALDAARKRRRRAELLSRETLPVAVPPAADARFERAAARTLVRKALDTLSPKERTAVLMREEGYTHREIADALDTTTGSVGTLLARALRKAGAALAGVQEAS